MEKRLERLRNDVADRYEYWRAKEHNAHSIEAEARMSECQHLLLLLKNALQKNE